jgi:predicted RNA-binding Zn-ribbon protein involved in translation (DUF1610 family)
MSFYSPRNIYAPHYMQLGRNLNARAAKPKKGQLCPKCGHVRQFHKVNCNWVRPDAAVILNNYYPVKVCPSCSHHIYPTEMLKEYNQLKNQKVLV